LKQHTAFRPTLHVLGCGHIRCERTRPDTNRCALITYSSANDTARHDPAAFGIGVIFNPAQVCAVMGKLGVVIIKLK
jgi:hypothetical protein